MAALISLLAVTAPAATIHVPADQPTIQQAINASSNGDLILVSPGTYFEHIDYDGKAITIRSIAGPLQTILDGNHAAGPPIVNFQNHETPQSVLSGFTLQRANNGFAGAIAMFVASPTITENIFRNNGQNSPRRCCDRREYFFGGDRT